ncbi:MAG: hypothetical protein HC897_14345 [Thermoanaerobaculia bacterium]|nr:hypothetical protein [Thermoanaerobaculia bacterium]
MGFYWYALFPVVCNLWGYMPGKLGMGEDVPKGVILEWASWCRHPEYAFGRLDGAREQAASFRSPLLALSFSDDPYAPAPSVDALLGQFSATQPVHRHLTPAEVGLERIGHFGFFARATASCGRSSTSGSRRGCGAERDPTMPPDRGG